MFKHILMIALLVTNISCYAASIDAAHIHGNGDLQKSRIKTVESYYSALEHKTFNKLNNLFIENGKVITTKVGAVKPREFFPKRFSTISVFNTRLLDIYAFHDKYFVKYHLAITDNGIPSTREFLEEIEFKENSKKINTIHMFENKY